MGISEKELKKLISIKVDVEKVSTVSSDGKNLLSRIPKDICEFLEIKKGNKMHWFVNENKQIKLRISNEN
jgi:hypothetical protein